MTRTFGHKVRTRVCGIAVRNNKILLVRHAPLGPEGYLWSPPGGGAEYGLSLKEQLIREFDEETGLQVEVGEFMFINEYLHSPIHAIEVFFSVKIVSGELGVGHDPELSFENQMIKEVGFLDFEQIKKMNPFTVHNCFRYCSNIDELLNLKGYFIFQNN